LSRYCSHAGITRVRQQRMRFAVSLRPWRFLGRLGRIVGLHDHPTFPERPMTKDEVVTELAALGNEATKKVLMRHGAREPFYGVKVEDLKKIQKRVKKDHQLALALFATGISDAMYLAGMIADPSRMKKSDLERWVNKAYWYLLSEYTVAGVAAESPHGAALARKWIESDTEAIASCGWCTFSGLVALKPDEELDLAEIEELLDRVEAGIHAAPNRVRYTMNGFVIAVGSAVTPLTQKARAVAQAVGKVEVDMGGTACKVPAALAYIEKVEQAGKLGKKRKSVIC
jgi:3-methyladenine DNA glycosylase AlkD